MGVGPDWSESPPGSHAGALLAGEEKGELTVVTDAESEHDKQRFVSWCERRREPGGEFPRVADDRASLWSPLVRRFAEIGREIFLGDDVAAVLGNVIQTAEKAILGAEFASITVSPRPGTLNTVSGNAHGARGLDELQERFGQGPVVEATRADGTGMASSPNLAEEPAWPEFGPHAAKEGVRSVLCAGMFESQGSGTGALSVYSREPRGLAAATPDIGLVLASCAATALAGTEAASEEELARFRIQEPLRSVNALERAAHVLIRKRHLTAEDAYDVLCWTSDQLRSSG